MVSNLLLCLILIFMTPRHFLNAMKMEKEENGQSELVDDEFTMFSVREELRQLLIHSIDDNILPYKNWLEENAKINALDRGGRTIFMFAVARNKEEYLQPLIRLGAQANMKDKNGLTALSYAIINDARKCLTFLIKADVDVTAKDSRGRTSLKIAEDWQRSECIKIILLHVFQKIFSRSPERFTIFIQELAFIVSINLSTILLKLDEKNVNTALIFYGLAVKIVALLQSKKVSIGAIDDVINKYY